MKKFLILLKLFLLANVALSQSSDWMAEASKPGANFYSIRKKYSAKMDEMYKKNAPSNLLTKIAKKLPENNPESPVYEAVKYKRWEWYWSSRINADGSFPTDEQKKKSLQEVMDMDEKNNSGEASFVDAASKANWTNISKTSIDGGYWGNGLTASIAYHPTDNNTFWVTADVGGIWKTTNGGSAYTQIGNSLPYQAVGAFAVDRNNVNNIVVATGNGLGSSGITSYSLGLYRTTNGGTSWSSVKGATFAEQIRYNTVVQSPSNASVVYACSNKDFLVSNDGGVNWGPRFTTPTPCSDFKISAANTNVQYMMLSGSLYKSTDGGASITFVRTFTTNTTATVRVALAPTDVNKLVVYTSNLGGASFIFGSADGGATWAAKTNLGGSPYPDIMTFSANNSNILYAGNLDMYKSTNFGTSWSRLSSYCCGSGPNFLTPDGLVEVHADHRNILVHPRTKEIFSCNDGGIDKYNETTNKWTRLSNGLLIAQYYSVASSENNATKLIVGSQDNGGAKRNSNGSWSNTNGGDAGKQAIDPTNDNIYYTHYNPDPEIYRTTDNGATTTNVRPTDATENWWVTPYLLKPGAPSTIFAGYHAVYRSDNRGDTWTKVSPDLTTKDFFSVLRELAVAPSNANFIYAASEFKLFKTTTGNTSGWTNVTWPQPITGIAVKDNAPSTVYICNGGYSAGNKVFKSTDGGATFTNISAGLPNIVIYDIIYQKNSNEHLYVATDFGVYYRTASMTSWARYGNGLPNVTVNELNIQYSSGKLRAATFGRGLYETDALVTSTPPPAGALANGTYTIVNRNSGLVMDVTGGSTADNIPIVQYTPNGANNQKYQVTALGGGEYSIKPVHSLALNKGLDMPGGSLADGIQVIQYGYGGAANQKWKIIAVGGGYYQIQNVNSAKALVVESASVTAGAKVIQFPYSGTLNEQWQFTATTAARASTAAATIVDAATNTMQQDLSVFPMPAKDNVKVTYNNKDNAQTAIVSVLNQYGTIVSQQKWQLVKGANAINVNTEKLLSGTYYVNVYSTTSKQHRKITIVVMK
jgi:hypothetical protein